MKKVFFTLAILIGFVSISMAQLDLKFQAGLNTSHLTNEHSDWKTEGHIGWQFGASALVGNKLYFEPGVFWTTVTKDVINKNDSLSQDAFRNTVNSIRIPAHIGYHILGSEETLADLRLFAGFGASIVTSVKNDNDQLKKEDFKKFLFDFNAGVGVDIWIFFVEWNYVLGLTPVFVEDGEGENPKMQAFMGNAGVRIRF